MFIDFKNNTEYQNLILVFETTKKLINKNIKDYIQNNLHIGVPFDVNINPTYVEIYTIIESSKN